MENLIIQGTDSTPGIILDKQKHYIEFTGDSRPENVKMFFEPVLNWISEYMNHIYFFSNESSKKINIIVDFKFEYFNSSSAKYIIDIINALTKIKSTNKNVDLCLNWCYEEDDDDIKDAGQEFVKITGIPMSFILIKL
ncbi:MAG: DUF1987 domain-containing protein [Burkholderiales bacterium]|nr:DUF1987 domain-containing protein [Bacteroidia bacterium]